MTDIRPLGGVPFERIHASWVRAFSDYKVKIDMPIDLLRAFFKQNSVHLDASMGAFEDGELVGLWMNGLRDVDGAKTAYDSGTAIWPEHRSKGISKLLAEASSEHLRSLGVKEYVLEVISTNERAYNVYLKDGFTVTRKFRTIKKLENNPHKIKDMDGIIFNEGPFASFDISSFPKMEYDPSWQNRTVSMENIRDLIHTVVAMKGKDVVGYGFMQPGRGRISQIGFVDECWENGVAGELLNRLCSTTKEKEIMVVNIDESAKRTLDLYHKNGFTPFIEQFEMKKPL